MPLLPDEGLDDFRNRIQQLIDFVRGYEGKVNGVELPWNESHQTITQDIQRYGQICGQSTDMIKSACPWLEVWGGGFSEGNPPSFNDFEQFDAALGVIDVYTCTSTTIRIFTLARTSRKNFSTDSALGITRSVIAGCVNGYCPQVAVL